MVFGLFKKKDDFGIYNFIKDINNLNKNIISFQKENKSMDLEKVTYVINEVKSLHKRAKEINLILRTSTEIKDKKKELMLSILERNFENLRKLYEKVKIYEEQLKEYKTLEVKNKDTKFISPRSEENKNE